MSGSRDGAGASGSSRRRWRRAGWWALGLSAFYLLFGFFGVPLLIRHAAVPQINKRLNGELTLARARTNPLRFSVELEGAELKDASGRKVLGFSKFEGNFQVVDTVFKRGWHFLKAEVTDPFVSAEVSKEGTLNLAGLLKPPTKPGKPREPLKRIPRVVFTTLGVTRADVDFVDRSLPEEAFEYHLKDLDFRLDGLDTRPESNNPLRFTATAPDGRGLAWEGRLSFDPLSSEGTLRAERLRVARFMPYGVRYTPTRVTEGELSAEASYVFAPARTPRVARALVKSLEIEGLRVERGGKEVLAAGAVRLTGVDADADARSLAVERVEVESPEIRGELTPEGGFTLADLVRTGLEAEVEPDARVLVHAAGSEGSADGGAAGSRVDPATIEFPIQRLTAAVRGLLEDAAGSWALDAGSIEVRGGRASWLDTTTRRPVGVQAEDVTFKAGPVGTKGRFATDFEAGVRVLEGTASASGRIEPMDRKGRVSVKVSGVALQALAPYLPQRLAEQIPPAEVASAVVSVDGTLSGVVDESERAAAVWEGTLELERLLVNPAEGGGSALMSAERASVGGKAEASASAAGLESLSWSGKAEAAGVKADPALSGRAGGTLASAGFEGTLRATGGSAPEASAQGRAVVSMLEVGVLGDSGGDGPEGRVREGSFDGGAAFKDGRLTVEGTLSGAGLAGARKGPEAFEAAIESAGFSGRVSAAVAEPLKGTVSGDARAEGVSATAPASLDSARVAVSRVALSGLEFDGGASMAAARELVIEGPEVRASRAILPAAGAEKAPAASGPRDVTVRLPEGFPGVRLGRLAVSGGTVEVRDEGTSPPTVLSADQIELSVVNVSTEPGEVAEVKLSSRVAGTARAGVEGRVAPFREGSPMADVTVSVASLPVKPFEPIAARYAGFLVESGRASVTLPVKVENAKLSGALNFDLERFYLGEKVESPDAPDLPLKLGLALLRDSEERIEGKIPLSGDLTSPDFSVGGLVWRAFLGLIGKAVTAPFQVLGALLGSEEKDLSFVEFEGGSAELSPEAVSTLDTLARALEKRPGLSLRVVGRVNSEADGLALRRAALRESLLAEASRQDAALAAFTQEQYRAAVEAAFVRRELEKLSPQEQRDREREERRRRREGLEPEPATPFETMEAALLVGVETPEGALAALAESRARAAARVLVENNGIAAARVTVEPAGEGEDEPDSPRALFELF